MPTSCFLCETGGMIANCAGTTGDDATLDLRYRRSRRNRLQGSHAAQIRGASGLVARQDDSCPSRAMLVNAQRSGLRTAAGVRAEPAVRE